MKKLIIPVLLLLFVLAACGSTAQPSSTPPAQSNVPESNTGMQSNIPENSVSAESSIPLESGMLGDAVTVMYAEDLPSLSGEIFDEYIDDNSEYQVRVAFLANEPVTSFQFFPVQFADVDEDGRIIYDMGEALYTADPLLPQHPLVVAMAFPGDTPPRGFSYVDTSGNAHYFALTMSGEDGSLEALAFEP